MIETLDNFNMEDGYNKSSLISDVVKKKFNLFKKVGAVVLAGLSMSQVLHQNLYATTNNTNSDMIVKKQENSNSKSKSVNFFKTLDLKKTITLSLISSTAIFATEHLVVNPIYKLVKFIIVPSHKKKCKSERDVVTSTFKELRHFLKTDGPVGDYLSALENFGLKLCDYKEKNKSNNLNKYSFKELLDIEELELQKLLDATKKIYEANSIDNFELIREALLREVCKLNDVCLLLEKVSASLITDLGAIGKLINETIFDIIDSKYKFCQNHNFISDLDLLLKNIEHCLNIKLKDFVSPQNSKQYGDLKIQLYNFLDNYYSVGKVRISDLKCILAGDISEKNLCLDETLKNCLLKCCIINCDHGKVGTFSTNDIKQISDLITTYLFDDFEQKFNNDIVELFDNINDYLDFKVTDFMSLDSDSAKDLQNKLLKFLENYHRTKHKFDFNSNKSLREELLKFDMFSIKAYGTYFSKNTYKTILSYVNMFLLDENNKRELEQTRELFEEVAKLQDVTVSDFINDTQYDSLRESIYKFLNKYFCCVSPSNYISLVKHCFNKTNSAQIIDSTLRKEYNIHMSCNYTKKTSVYLYLKECLIYESGFNIDGKFYYFRNYTPKEYRGYVRLLFDAVYGVLSE